MARRRSSADKRLVRRGTSYRRLVSALAAAGIAAACAAHSPSNAAVPGPFPRVLSPSAVRPAPAALPDRTISHADILATALQYRGVPYRYGGDSPTSGFDCSGYVQFVMARHSILVPRTAAEQFQIGQPVRSRDVRAGDLVFFTTIAPGASHVGLATSATEFVHAPATSGVVRVERLTSSYWQSRFVGARRLFSE